MYKNFSLFVLFWTNLAETMLGVYIFCLISNKSQLTAGLGENTNENKGIGGKGNLWEDQSIRWELPRLTDTQQK